MDHVARTSTWGTFPTYTNTTTMVLTSLTIPTIFMVVFNVSTAITRDYQAYLSLGPGGSPASPVGYIRVKFLGLFAIRDPYTPMPVPIHFKQQTGYLSKLPTRLGERPTVRGIAPHRQTNQKAPSNIFATLRAAIVRLSEKHPDILIQKTSCLEKHGPGLFVTEARHLTPHCNGEVCHAHPSDGSMHLTLHPADAAVVLRAGWGERHPLGKGGWLQNFVPAGFILVYAPRNEKEVEVLMQIVRAAIWWVGGVDVGSGAANSSNDAPELKSGAFREIEVIRNDWLAACPDPKQAVVLS